MNQEKRCEVITDKFVENPNRVHDYIVDIKARIGKEKKITLRYVPDENIIQPEKFCEYVNIFTGEENLEKIAGAIIEDLNNEFLPRWIRVTVSEKSEKKEQSFSQRVIIEDRQPGWQNSELMEKLKAV